MNASKEQLQQIKNIGLQALGLYLGKYRGFVEDNNDPKNAGRVRLTCPQVWGEGKSLDYWAYPFGMFSGAGFGLILPPPKGEMVWVEFEQGNPSYPIWTYGHFGKNDKPAQHENNKQFILISPGGNYIRINDEKEEIEITRKQGGEILINKKGISLIRDGGKVSLGDLNNSNQSAVLGEKNADVLTDLANDLKDLIVEIGKLMAAITTESAANAAVLPVLAPASAVIISSIGGITTQLVQITANISLLLGGKINNTKSKSVTLD